MKNIEQKFYRKSEDVLKTIEAWVLHDSDNCRFWKTENQEDIFFASDSGRLKLRIVELDYKTEKGELISYHRSDSTEARSSDYFLYTTSFPRELHEVLSKTLKILGTIRKKRLVYVYRHTRIHVDSIENLGEFIEFETATEEIGEEKARQELAKIISRLNLPLSDSIDVAYFDLLMAKG